MLLTNPKWPGRRIWLGYCLNAHPGDCLEEIEEGISAISCRLRDRLAPGGPFGIGIYLPAKVARDLALHPLQLARLRSFLAAEALVAFTANAFPHGDFQRAGLKEQVYDPVWGTEARHEFTVDVAFALRGLCSEQATAPRHLSISTHPGGYGGAVAGRSRAGLASHAEGLRRIAAHLLELNLQAGPPLSLALEAEPWASASNQAELAEFLIFARTKAAQALRSSTGKGLGCSPDDALRLAREVLTVCLDTCHAALEFEEESAWRLANLESPVGKVQLSSALALVRPRQGEAGRRALLDLDEPVYLHQVAGRTPSGEILRASDLNRLAQTLGNEPAWLDCAEWRCHFHVPVDLEQTLGLATTRAALEAILGEALADPTTWRHGELHLEIETYTWSILPEQTRGRGSLVDGIEREFRHALGLLEAAGWSRSGA